MFIVELEDEKSLKVNLEMNNTKYISSITISRNVYYLSNFHSIGLKEKEDYDKLLQTIQYNFNRGYVDRVNKEKIDEYYLRNKYGNILTEDIKIVHINIDELSKLWYSEKRNQYSKNYQILCGLSALMVCTKKSKLENVQVYLLMILHLYNNIRLIPLILVISSLLTAALPGATIVLILHTVFLQLLELFSLYVL